MRSLLIGAALAALTLALSACGGSGATAGIEEALQRQADKYAISEIQRAFHKAMTKKDIELMMGIWAPNATFTFGPGQTAAGREKIRKAWLKSTPFKPKTNWISDHPAYKLRVTVNGDRGTLHFECHYIDLDTERVAAVTAADMDVARIDGRWLVTKMVGGTAELSA